MNHVNKCIYDNSMFLSSTFYVNSVVWRKIIKKFARYRIPMEHSVSVETFKNFKNFRLLESYSISTILRNTELFRSCDSNAHGKWHRSDSCIVQAGRAKGKVNKGQRRRIVRVSKHEKARVIESALKIRSYLPGNTSAVRHASTLFLAVMVVSRTKGRPALHLYPENTAKAIPCIFPFLFDKSISSVGESGDFPLFANYWSTWKFSSYHANSLFLDPFSLTNSRKQSEGRVLFKISSNLQQ